MCLVRPALLYLNVHVLKVFYEQMNYRYVFQSKGNKWPALLQRIALAILYKVL